MWKFLKDYRDNYRLFSFNSKVFLLGGVFNGLGMAVFGLLFNLYLKEYGYQETQIGNILSFGALGATIIAVPSAMLIERISMKRILLWTTIISSVCSALAIYFHELKLIMLFYFMANMLISVYRVCVAPFFMRNSTPRERIYLFSFQSAMMMLSQLFGFMLGGYLPKILISMGAASTLTQSYEISLYASILASLISIFPFILIKPQAHTPSPRKLMDKLRHYSWGIILKLMIPKLLIGMGAGLVIPFMNLYFKNIFRLDSDSIGFFFSIMQVGLFFGMMLSPLISRKFGMLNSIVLTELFSIPFMLILALTNNLPLAVLAFIFRGTLMNMSVPISANFEMELVKPGEQAFTNAVSMLAWNGAWTISASLGGAIIEKYSFAYSFYVTIILYLVSAISYYLFFGKFKTQRTRK